jgi:hypothetical protein
MNPKLAAIVQQHMADLIEEYGLVAIEVDSDEVLLQSSSYVLDISADRDGVAIMYFDTSKRPLLGCNLFHFLAHHRRDQLVFAAKKPETHTYLEFVSSQLSYLARHLRSAGRDILGGSKAWLADLRVDLIPPVKAVAARIR